MKPIIHRLAYMAADHSGLKRREIFTRNNARRVAWPRFAVMRVAREQGRSFPQIARYLGLKDHTSVRYGCFRADEIATFDPAFAGLLGALREEAERAE